MIFSTSLKQWRKGCVRIPILYSQPLVFISSQKTLQEDRHTTVHIQCPGVHFVTASANCFDKPSTTPFPCSYWPTFAVHRQQVFIMKPPPPPMTLFCCFFAAADAFSRPSALSMAPGSCKSLHSPLFG